jgi:NADPH:quinone reductase-like Zn-dependent oxidoreductase
VRSLGADRVIDYRQEDFTRSGERYDVLFDVAGSRSWFSCARVLEPRGILVAVGAPNAPLVGPLGHIAAMRLCSLGSRRTVVFFVAKFNRPDLETLAALMAEGKLRPVYDRTYPLEEIADALRALGEGRVRSKLVLTV